MNFFSRKNCKHGRFFHYDFLRTRDGFACKDRGDRRHADQRNRVRQQRLTAGVGGHALVQPGRQLGPRRLVSAASGDKTINGLLGVIASSGLTPSSQVNLSDAALSFGSTDSQNGDTSLSQIAQALMVALILQLLDPGGGTTA